MKKLIIILCLFTSCGQFPEGNYKVTQGNITRYCYGYKQEESCVKLIWWTGDTTDIICGNYVITSLK